MRDVWCLAGQRQYRIGWMRLLADVHTSPRTVQFLNAIGHDVITVQSVLPSDALDRDIVETAPQLGRAVVTQDLGFSAILALTGASRPSIVSLRLSDPRVDSVNLRLQQVLPDLEDDVATGIIATVEDDRVRTRRLPL